MRVLIVEDDRPLGLFLQKGLSLEGHQTAWVEDGETALARIQSDRPELIVLDLSLPKRDGIEVLEAMQALGIEAAILILTGRSSAEERVRCLNLGADDCLMKPFSFHELTARCRAILRRLSHAEDTELFYGSIKLNMVRRTATCMERPVELTPKEFALLESLLRRQGTPCTRDELLREVWHQGSGAVTNVVDVYINYLRKKLAGVSPNSNQGAEWIETVRGQGYKIACPKTVKIESSLLWARGA